MPGSTGRRNLLDLAAIQKRIEPETVDSTLLKVGLRLEMPQKVRNYTLGMKQKLSLAQELMERPEVLILDEPFNALDSDSAVTLKSILQEEQNKGTTIIFTSHMRQDVDDLSLDPPVRLGS